MLNFRQVHGFGSAMRPGKGQHFSIAPPLRNRGDAFVNEDSARLTRMVRAQFALKVGGQMLCHKS